MQIQPTDATISIIHSNKVTQNGQSTAPTLSRLEVSNSIKLNHDIVNAIANRDILKSISNVLCYVY